MDISATYLATEQQLEQWVAQLKHIFAQRKTEQLANWLALDTEFIREKTYFPKLCLIQIAYPNNISPNNISNISTENTTNHHHEQTMTLACIDPLAIQDLRAFQDLLTDESITKVFHAAYQDQEILFQRFACVPKPIFDTQPAAAILGLGDQMGYARLVEALLNIQLEKSQSRTDWARRPLSDKQLAYALDDVRYLSQIFPLIQQHLIEKNRLSWLDNDFQQLSNAQTYLPDPEQAWKKIRGTQHLKGVQLAILQKMGCWRENEAINKNRPRRWILGDEVLVDIAKQAPKNKAALSHIRGAESDYLNQYHTTWLHLIRQAQNMPTAQWPCLTIRKKLNTDHEVLADLLMMVVRYQAHHHHISPQMIASRKQIEKMLINGEKQLNNDWRGNLVNSIFAKLLSGNSHILVEEGRVNIID
ncbi:MAG: ribonuclease D [bacterium]